MVELLFVAQALRNPIQAFTRRWYCRSLFRATIPLPANVPVGPLVARTYLFHNGQVVSAQIARVSLHRAGIERLVHNFAFVYPASYGIFAVLLAVSAGLLASAYFRRQPG